MKCLSINLSFLNLILLFLAQNIHAESYKSEAANWVKNYFSDYNQSDIQNVTNLVYLSYKRSKLTLKSQTIFTKSFAAFFDIFKNISVQRLDPAIAQKKVNIKMLAGELNKLFTQFKNRKI